ncbi:MAG: glycosyltransferase [Bacilli bacterium]|nr:glycosyltransferase [Bacilli bacterium]
MKKISFVIPCYGSELTIGGVVEEIISKVKEKKEYDYEIILVNDQSYDNVWEVISKIAHKNDKIKALNLSKNMNKPGALMAGLSIAKGDFVTLLDDDGQCPMNEFWTMFDCALKHDVVMAKYPVKKQSAFKNFGSFVNKKMAEVLIGKPKKLYFNNFSIIKSYVVKEIIKYDKPYPYVEGLILRVTNDIVNVTVEERKRSIGKSNFTFKKMLKMWINGFTSFSVKPLRLSTYIGFICAFIGFIYGIYIVIEKFTNSITVVGYSSLMAAILFIGGLILMMLGLIGEYVGRIYISINRAPQYVVKESINVGDSDEKV